MSDAFSYIPLIAKGAVVTLQLAIFGSLVALIAAFAAGLGRISRHWAVRAPASLFIEFFRGTSIYVQLFWAYFVLPLYGMPLTPFQAGVLVLGLNTGAYAAEIVRGAILAIPREQYEACIALNLTSWQKMRHVVLPQAVVLMLPPFANSAIELLKGTAVVSLISLFDMTFAAVTIRTQTGNTAVPFLTILVIYFILSMLISRGFRALERRAARASDGTGARS